MLELEAVMTRTKGAVGSQPAEHTLRWVPLKWGVTDLCLPQKISWFVNWFLVKNIYWVLARCSKQATKYFTRKQTALLQSAVPSYEHKHERVALFNFRRFYLKSSFPLSFVTRPSSCNSSWPSVLPMWKCLNIYLYSEVPNAAASILIVRSLL